MSTMRIGKQNHANRINYKLVGVSRSDIPEEKWEKSKKENVLMYREFDRETRTETIFVAFERVPNGRGLGTLGMESFIQYWRQANAVIVARLKAPDVLSECLSLERGNLEKETYVFYADEHCSVVPEMKQYPKWEKVTYVLFENEEKAKTLLSEVFIHPTNEFVLDIPKPCHEKSEEMSAFSKAFREYCEECGANYLIKFGEEPIPVFEEEE